jgi:Cof subfamily protein (haloacid dehalogenase superfamily)
LKRQRQQCDKKAIRGLFVADLDGTLLTDDKQIGPEDLETLSRLHQMGYLIAIATGRSNFSVNKLLRNLFHSGNMTILPVDYIIFSTGAGIMSFPKRRVLKSISLNAKDVLFISSFLENSDIDYMIHRPVPDTRFFLYSSHGQHNPDFQTRLNLYKDFATPLSSFPLESFGGATEILCILPEDGAHECAALLAVALKQFSVIKATSPLDGRSIWVEIFSPMASKSQAVKWLARKVGVRRDQVCAIGNDYNDEDLLQWAGMSYIVANSPPTLHSRFQMVSSNNEAGVSEAAACWLGNSHFNLLFF